MAALMVKGYEAQRIEHERRALQRKTWARAALAVAIIGFALSIILDLAVGETEAFMFSFIGAVAIAAHVIFHFSSMKEAELSNDALRDIQLQNQAKSHEAQRRGWMEEILANQPFVNVGKTLVEAATRHEQAKGGTVAGWTEHSVRKFLGALRADAARLHEMEGIAKGLGKDLQGEMQRSDALEEAMVQALAYVPDDREDIFALALEAQNDVVGVEPEPPSIPESPYARFSREPLIAPQGVILDMTENLEDAIIEEYWAEREG